MTAAVVEALAAGPARTTLRSLVACSLQLDWGTVLKLLPQVSWRDAWLVGEPGVQCTLHERALALL